MGSRPFQRWVTAKQRHWRSSEEAGDAVFAPAVGGGSGPGRGRKKSQALPGVAVVFADGPPLPFAEARGPISSRGPGPARAASSRDCSAFMVMPEIGAGGARLENFEALARRVTAQQVSLSTCVFEIAIGDFAGREVEGEWRGERWDCAVGAGLRKASPGPGAGGPGLGVQGAAPPAPPEADRREPLGTGRRPSRGSTWHVPLTSSRLETRRL